MILEPRANARFLSLMTGLFNAQSAENPFGRTYFTGKEPGTTKIGEKVFSEALTLQERHRQPDPAAEPDRRRRPPLGDVTWVEKGVLKNLAYNGAYARRARKSR